MIRSGRVDLGTPGGDEYLGLTARGSGSEWPVSSDRLNGKANYYVQVRPIKEAECELFARARGLKACCSKRPDSMVYTFSSRPNTHLEHK